MTAPHLIVIGYEDWAALYVGDSKVMEDHDIRIEDLVRHAQGRAFTLEKIQGDGPALLFDTFVTDTGSWPADVPALRAALADVQP